MKTRLELSVEDHDLVCRLLQQHSRTAGFTITLDLLLDRWRGFVNQVEVGYDLSIYDYENDLSARYMLDEIIDQVTSDSRGLLQSELTDLDGRFIAATREDVEDLIRTSKSSDPGLWNRIPLRLVGELKSDLAQS